jgi:hypothetical protein
VVCKVSFQDYNLFISTTRFGSICHSKKASEFCNNPPNFLGWAVRTFRDWSVEETAITEVMLQFMEMDNSRIGYVNIYLDVLTINGNFEKATIRDIYIYIYRRTGNLRNVYQTTYFTKDMTQLSERYTTFNRNR